MSSVYSRLYISRWSIGLSVFASLGVTLLLSTSDAYAQSPTLTTLYNFNFDSGVSSQAAVTIGADGKLYGTTFQAGTSDLGTLYCFDPISNSLTTLVNFNFLNGAKPRGSLSVGSDGNLYGTTTEGGSGNAGTLFRFNPVANSLTTLVNFSVGNGSSPSAALTFGANGAIYGTTEKGGTNNRGTLYRFNPANNNLTTLVNFDNSNGSNPYSGVIIGGNGSLYGTTEGGGASNLGTIFRYNETNNTLTTLASFNTGFGFNPHAGMTFGTDGNLYGTALRGGSASHGTFYRFNSTTNDLTTLFSFIYSNGSDPYTSMTVGPDGNLYGTTFNGGNALGGILYRFNPLSSSMTTVFNFGNNGANPFPSVTFDSSGNAYGTTYTGGSNNQGTLFKLSGVLTAPEPGSLLLIAPLILGGLVARQRRRAG